MADGEGHVELVELSSGSESKAETPSRNLKPLEGTTSVAWSVFEPRYTPPERKNISTFSV